MILHLIPCRTPIRSPSGVLTLVSHIKEEVTWLAVIEIEVYKTIGPKIIVPTKIWRQGDVIIKHILCFQSIKNEGSTQGMTNSESMTRCPVVCINVRHQFLFKEFLELRGASISLRHSLRQRDVYRCGIEISVSVVFMFRNILGWNTYNNILMCIFIWGH